MGKEEQDRIHKLEDDRMEQMAKQVDAMHKLLLGNGQKGLVQKVEGNSARVKILMWVLALVASCLVGSFFTTTNKINEMIKNIPEIKNIPDISEVIK